LLSLLFYFRFIQKSLTLKTESLPRPPLSLSLTPKKIKKKKPQNEKKKKKQQNEKPRIVGHGQIFHIN